jgi:hypothetical protein
VALVAVAAIALLGGGGDEPQTAAGPSKKSRSATATATAQASRTPSRGSSTSSREDVSVAVLNGTTINGLASTVAKRLSQAGFGSGPTSNYTDQARSASVVFYADSGQRRAAFDAAKVLNISDVQPIIDAAKQLAPGAQVVVVVGADQSP